MASSKRHKAYMLQRYPYCIYCGGSTPATTLDHVPSRQMFSLRQRPKGLEVPSCGPCNSATSNSEQVAAMIARSYPDPISQPEKDEVRRIMSEAFKDNPDLLIEMAPSDRQRQIFKNSNTMGAGVYNAQGPVLNRHLNRFGIKLIAALHFEVTKQIISNQGGIAVRWYSNWDNLQGNIPQELLELLGENQTLRQGKWDTGDQFGYCWATTEDKKLAAYFSWFRLSFAITGFVMHDASHFPKIPNMQIYQPLLFSQGGVT